MAIQPLGRVSTITGRGDSWDQFTAKLNSNFQEAGGTVTPGVAVPDATAGTEVDTINALLASLRDAGFIAPA